MKTAPAGWSQEQSEEEEEEEEEEEQEKEKEKEKGLGSQGGAKRETEAIIKIFRVKLRRLQRIGSSEGKPVRLEPREIRGDHSRGFRSVKDVQDSSWVRIVDGCPTVVNLYIS